MTCCDGCPGRSGAKGGRLRSVPAAALAQWPRGGMGDVELAADLRECWTADAVTGHESLYRLTQDRLVQLITFQDYGFSVHAWIEAQRARGWTVPALRLARASTMKGMTLAKRSSGRAVPQTWRDPARKAMDTGSNTEPFYLRRPPERLVCGTCGKVARARWAFVLPNTTCARWLEALATAPRRSPLSAVPRGRPGAAAGGGPGLERARE